MLIPIWLLSLSLVVSVWLGPGLASGAQLLSDSDLDGVTAAGGTSWNVDLLPANVAFGTTPSVVQPSTALSSAQSAIFAAEASVAAAKAVNGSSGLAVASSALGTASTALKDVSTVNGVNAVNAGEASLQAAAAILNTVPPEKVTPAIIDAAKKVTDASAALKQAGLSSGAVHLTSALQAVSSASLAIDALPKGGVDADFGPAIDAAANSIQAAKKAVEVAFEAQLASGGGTQTSYVLTQNGDGTLDPILRLSFKTGRTSGQGEIYAVNTSLGKPTNPLNLDGASFINGKLPLTLIAENLVLNLSICQGCIAETIIQNNKAFVVPIYAP